MFGYLFYLFTPYIIGVSEVFEGLPGIDLYQGFFKLIPPEKLQTYLWITLSWLPAFYLGHLAFSVFGGRSKTVELFPATPTSDAVSYFAILLMGVLVLFAYIGRQSLFGGYGSYDEGARGKISTLLVLFNFFLVYQLISAQKVSRVLIVGTVITCFFLLSMGGRMYVFQTFVVLLIYKTSFSPKKWKFRQVAIFSFLGFLIGSSFGLWRMGSSLNFEKSLYSFFAEPAFTWFSTSTYLIFNDLPAFNFPSNFFTSFLNLIPNTFFSFKPYIVSTGSMVNNYQNPLGADSVWSTFVINFGYIGSFFFMFLTGFMLNFLKSLSTRHRFWGAYYIMVCGLLPFQFFRDGFYILHKQLYFNFLFLPGFILLSLKTYLYLTSVWKKKQQRIATATLAAASENNAVTL
ncbi:MAG: O-antigen polymerase [Chitinophagaceae bacterium]